MLMPIVRAGAQNVSIFDSTPVTLPSNHIGDHCDNQSDNLCGYWYSNGWSDSDLTVYPDPEDWRAANNHANTYVSCIFR